jgi:hypothetical protein
MILSSYVKTHLLKIILLSVLYSMMGLIFNLTNAAHRAHRYSQLSDVSYLLVFTFSTCGFYYIVIYFLSKTITSFEMTGQSIKANRYRRLRRLIFLSAFLFCLQGLIFFSEIYRQDYFPSNWKRTWFTETALPSVLYMCSLFFMLYLVRPRQRTVAEIEESLSLKMHTADELSLSILPHPSLDDARPTALSDTTTAVEVAWTTAPSIKKVAYLESLPENDKDASKTD